MSKKSPAPIAEPVEDLHTVVVEGVKDAARRASSAVTEARKPGRPLDLLARIGRQAPLGSMLVAFLFGVAVERRGRADLRPFIKGQRPWQNWRMCLLERQAFRRSAKSLDLGVAKLPSSKSPVDGTPCTTNGRSG